MTAKPAQLRGECYCRAVAYDVADAFEYALNCHCSDCRRATGSAFKPFAGIATNQFSIVRGQERLARYGDEVGHNAHCTLCGSLLYSRVRDGAYVHVTLGTLNDTPSIRPTAHIFVGSKAPWHTISDGLPQFAELPPD
jgi:hypothetical protein